jgi:hypothetical protein
MVRDLMVKTSVHIPRWGVWAGLVLVFFGALAPTLTWLEFSGGMENLNIATALELRRDHPVFPAKAGDMDSWLIPTLEGETRVKKPPLTAWITAAAIRPQTVVEMSDPDPALRRAADERLAWEVRWPSLLAACLMLVAIYELGRVIADPMTGLVAALIAGSTAIFLRFGTAATIDVHLGLWVTVSNVFLAHAALKGRRWVGCLGAGAAMGVAFMLKGPVAWVQTLLPVAVFVVVRWYREYRGRRRALILPWIAPVSLGGLLMLCIALPWYLYVIRMVPEGWRVWLHEAEDQTWDKPSAVGEYLAFLPYLLPWTISFIGGVISARRGMTLAVFLAILPLVAITFYKDRKDRYMIPMTGPACVVAAGGVMALARKREAWTGWERAAIAQHWGLLVILGVVVPAVAATTWVSALRTIDGEPWLSRAWGAGLTMGLGLLIAGGMMFRQRWLAALVGVTVVAALVVRTALIPGYAKTAAGLSPMRPLAEAIWRNYPDALMYNAHPRGKRSSVDLSIYMNRVTTWNSLEELASFKPGAQPRVVVMLQDAKDVETPAPPAGWKFVHKTRRGNDWWWAFVLERERPISNIGR